MGVKMLLSVSLLYYQEEKVEASAWGYYLILHYFRNCEIKNTGFIHFFRSLQAIITGLILVLTQTQLEPVQIDYDQFSAWRDQIIIYLIPPRIYKIKLLSLASVYIYCIFVRCCLIIKRECHNKIYVPQFGILSESSVGASMWIFDLMKNTRWYEGWKVLYYFAGLLVTLGSLTWEHLDLRWARI